MGDTTFRKGGIDFNAQQVHIGGDVAGRDITKVTNVYEASQPLVLNLHQIPAPPRDFTGRENEINAILTSLDRGATISGLRGMGGIGKTALALVITDRMKDKYPDAQFFFDMRGSKANPATPFEVMQHVIRGYHPTLQLPDSEIELHCQYLTVLHEKRAIILLDDAHSAQQIEPLVPPLSCLLLITSRQHFHVQGLYPTDLATLPPDDAHKLLLTITERIGEAATEIARLCGYLPLALQLTGKALAERVDLSLPDYIRRLSDIQKRLQLTGVTPSLQLSYDLLTNELQKQWRQLAVFPADFDRDAAAHVWIVDEDTVQDALSELVKYSLADFLPMSARYRLHNLARLFADSCLSDDERYAAQRRYAEHYKNVLSAANELCMRGGDNIMRGLELSDLEWGNIKAVQAWAEKNMTLDPERLRICSELSLVGTYVLYTRLNLPDRIHWLNCALDSSKSLADQVAEGVLSGNLGIAYTEIGKVDTAIVFLSRWLEIARDKSHFAHSRQVDDHDITRVPDKQLQNPSSPDYSTIRVIGAERQWTFQDGSQSPAVYKLQPIIIGIVGHIGIMRNQDDSTGVCEQPFAIRDDITKPRGTISALVSLGAAHFASEDSAKAIECFEEARTLLQQSDNELLYGTVIGNLAVAYARTGALEYAASLYKERLSIAENLNDGRDIIYALLNFGSFHFLRGDYETAVEYNSQALNRTCKIMDRRLEGLARAALASTLYPLGKQEDAITQAEAALHILEQIGDSHAEQVRQYLAERRQGKE